MRECRAVRMPRVLLTVVAALVLSASPAAGDRHAGHARRESARRYGCHRAGAGVPGAY